nr:PrsW family intramembrane metalloprotease [candidate division Zixibacteria bacterium]
MRLRYILITTALIFIAASGWAALRASRSISEFRERGSVRKYIFYMNEQEFGRLESKCAGEKDFDDRPSYRFDEKLHLDYSAFGRDYVLDIDNRHYVDDRGYYVGDEMKLKSSGQSQTLHLGVQGDGVAGYYTRNQNREEVNLPMAIPFFAVDNNLIDQYEIFLAMHNIRIGDTLSDTIFIPQSLYRAAFKIVIENFIPVRYGDMADSAYVCRFLLPNDQTMYFTRDKKIIKLSQPSQKLEVILSESPLDKMAPPKSPFGFEDFFWRIPVYLVCLAVGLVFAIPFLRKYFRQPELYLILILGGFLFPLINQIQLPLQRWFAENYMIPGIKSGGSIYYYGLYSALISGLVQETLKLIPVALFFMWRHPGRNLTIALGVFCGLGFGIHEAASLSGAAYQSGALSIFSMAMFRYLMTILFHAVTGGAFGYALHRGWIKVIIVWLALVVIHAFINYLFIFVQKAVFDVTILEILTILIYLLLLLAVYLMVRRSR